jgi:uncharacterized protein YbjT (DUF2867 family)
MTILAIAGASGALGHRVAARARAAGHTVRVLTRDPARLPEALRAGAVVGDGRDPRVAAELVRGADAVFSCAGASVQVALGHGWRGYGAVDTPLNLALVEATRAAGRARFTYVSVFHTAAMRDLAYVAAHERVVAALAASGLPWAVVRPTGFFSAIAGSYVDLARRGKLPEIGDGSVRTNPIGDDDLAAACLEAIDAADPALELAVGGPEVLTRRRIGELAFAAIGRPPRFRRIPPGLARAGTAMLRLLHPRLGQFARFVAAISTTELVAPARGSERLADAFAAAAVTFPGSS